ncbi:YcnI family protein [Streptomyces sp. MST-110588]|uniref:YcnI family copper-binding membrane protein n=1 Tax=Streptomyces sp. MST-110588 TaxID=2833628 RepID=UPI001F5D91A2|nr:YcnI family protein [Streptomyces sp. MST-110588]UNO40869.1 YcnI family protein [Streptomyces sp. MST-110588]
MSRTTAPSRRLVRRLPLIGGVAAGSVLLLAAPAFAHVSVQPGQAEKGGYATINFKVPNEQDAASTVKLEVTLPADHPLASVMPQPVPGWKAEVTKTKLAKPIEMHGKKIDEAPSKITWTADGGKIGPGEFQQFPLSVGKLPEDVDQLVFKALQTYDNKDVVRWIEPAKEGAEEPEHPAPVLKLVAASGDGHGAGAAGAAGAKSASTQNASGTGSSDNSDTTARVLGAIGILVGIVGVAFGVLAGRRRSA